MDKAKVEKSLGKLESGLNKYLLIMKDFHNIDVSKDLDFQKKYNGFYRMRQRKVDFYEDYFAYMQENKRNVSLTYQDVLTHFYEKFNRIEASFSSKLLATINPNMPIWDSVVMCNLGLKKPSYSCKDKLAETINIYTQIKSWYEDFLASDEAREWIRLFDEKYNGIEITDIKKIDVILWQIRED